MTVTLELSADVETRLRRAAARTGQTVEALLQTWIGEKTRLDLDDETVAPAVRLARMRPEERAAVLSAAAERAATLYEADLARPREERELTAFSSFDEPVLEPSDDEY